MITATTLLLLPLLLPLIGAMVALVVGLSPMRLRIATDKLAWGLAIFPLAAFVAALNAWLRIADGGVLSWQVNWLPSLGLSLGLYYDGLSALFVLLVSGIGVLVVIYAGQYFQGDQSAWRFQVYLLLFMSAMLGVVMAGDVITLFIFWEGRASFPTCWWLISIRMRKRVQVLFARCSSPVGAALPCWRGCSWSAMWLAAVTWRPFCKVATDT
ncbi:MAG: hypothetical protein R3E31_23300 [Chloroflexota bacterium]